MDETPAKPDQPTAVKSPRRRWHQFSLRTLLIGVALLSVPFAYVAHEYQIVAARKAWLEAPCCLDSPELPLPRYFRDASKSPTAIRLWLGDEPQLTIFAESRERAEVAHALFPEADVRIVEEH